MKILFATRPSALARWQTSHIIEKLHDAWDDLTCDQMVFTTRGDKVLDKSLPEIGGKGLFTFELEQALLDGRVQAAVHSLKDLPTEDPAGLMIGVIPQRADARDALVCPRGDTLATLPEGARVGTSSLRRQAQLLAHRPDLRVESVRGNVDTRLRKVQEGQYDAIILAAAGLIRLGLANEISEYLPFEIMLPAPGQGALAVQCRKDDEQTQRYLAALDHPATRLAVMAERTFLSALGGGCSLPVGAFAEVTDHKIHLQGLVAAPDGTGVIRLHADGRDPLELGRLLARRAIQQGAADLLRGVTSPVDQPTSS